MLEELEKTPYVETIYAFTRDTNRIAHKWYQNQKFRLMKVLNFYGPGKDAYCCVKNLNKE